MSSRRRPNATSRRLAERALLAVGTAAAAAAAFQLLLVAAAVAGRRRVPSGAGDAPGLRFVVLIPAHDEEVTLPGTLAAVAALDYPPELVRVVVVADNCEDATADIARAGGAEVLDRHATGRGKGAALSWALPRLGEDGAEYDAVLFLDADCAPSPNLLTAIDRRMRGGARAVQCSYVVANPTESWSAGLRYASFALMNTVRPQGRDALGLSSGILGSGFAIEREVLDRHGWRAFSLTEDTEYQLQLLDAGVRVRFAGEAEVSSPMPASLRDSREQHARWESGKLLMLSGWASRLLLAGMRKRDPAYLLAALEGALPPQSVLAAWSFVTALAGALLGSRPVLKLGLACAGAQGVYVLGGLRLAGAPATVYRALACAPLLMAWKLRLYVQLLTGRAPRDWERTPRGDR